MFIIFLLFYIDVSGNISLAEKSYYSRPLQVTKGVQNLSDIAIQFHTNTNVMDKIRSWLRPEPVSKSEAKIFEKESGFAKHEDSDCLVSVGISDNLLNQFTIDHNKLWETNSILNYF